MLKSIVGLSVFPGCSVGLALSVLQASVAGQIEARESAADLRLQDALAESAGAETASVENAAIVLIGRVVDADGTPHEGAVVVSSAGGRAVTDAHGAWRLEVAVPLDAGSVQVTAVARGAGGSFVASGQVAITGSSTAPSGSLMLGQGGCCQESWVPTFGGLPGVDYVLGGIEALTTFDDGSGPALYVGGKFPTAGGVAANGIARWDGSNWSTLGSGMNDRVSALTVFDDGNGPALYAGGDFTTAGGVAASRIAKWDGSNWSALGSGMNAPWLPQLVTVSALTVFDEGSGPALYAGGGFTTAGGVAARHIAKWDGSSWSALGSGVFNETVYALTVFDDGSGPALYAGGDSFATVMKWDGSSWSALGSGLGSDLYDAVSALTVFDDGGGSALYAGTSSASSSWLVAKWNGSSWSALGSGMNGSVLALRIFDDGIGPALYAGGSFTTAGGVTANRIARWDGSSWSALGSGMDNGELASSSNVRALAVFDDGRGPALHAGGYFFTAGGVAVRLIANWNGSSWTALGSGMNSFVGALSVFDDGGGPALYAGGGFSTAGGVAAIRIAKWDGSTWSPLGSGIVDEFPRALTVFDDGSGPALIAGGGFTTAGGVAANRIAKWDGSSWSPLGTGMSGVGSSIYVFSLSVYDDGSGPGLYAGGTFNTAGGVAASRIAKWDGSSWSPLGTGLDAWAGALTVFDDGSGPALFAGGPFTTAGGVPALGIAKWNGSSWSALGSGVNGSVGALAVFDDGTGAALYAGGTFTTAGGVAVNSVARWNGSSWSALGSGMNDYVSALAVFDDGNGPALYAGGPFTSAGGVAVNRIARWDGTSWSALGGGMNNRVSALAAFDDGSGPALYGGGSFTSALDSHDSFLAKWQCVDTTPPTVSCPNAVFVVDEPAPRARGMPGGGFKTSPPGEFVSFDVTAVDPCGPTPAVVCVPPSGSFFPRGKTMVTCTAADEAGNQATRSFPVVVMVPPRARRR